MNAAPWKFRRKTRWSIMNSALLLVILSIGVSRAFLLERNKEKITGTPKRNVCMTAVCRKKADEIKRSLNEKVNPCHDFYEFVCGGWKKEHPLTKESSNYGVFRMLDDQLNAELKTILSKGVHSGSKRQTVEDKARIAYQSCCSNGNPGEKDIHFLKRLMVEKGLEEWPLDKGGSLTQSPSAASKENYRTWSSAKPMATHMTELQTMLTTVRATESVRLMTESAYPEWSDSTIRSRNSQNERITMYPDFRYMLLKTGMSALFELGIARDPKKPSSHIIRLDQISFPLLGRNELMHPENKRNEASVRAYKTLIATALAIMKPSLQKKNIKVLADQIFAFERELAKRTAPKEDRNDEWKIENRTTIKELESAFPGLPLLDLLNKEFRTVNITLTENEVVSIFAMPYYASTTKLLHTTDPYTLYNYIGWRTMQKWASFASRSFREAEEAFKNVAFGYKTGTSLWKTCVRLLRMHMTEIVGRLYVTQKATPKDDKNVEAIVQSMRLTLQRRLENVAWMDKCTRKRALRKLKQMKANIGYPKWILDIGRLEVLYKNLGELNPRDPFLKIYCEISEHDRRRSLLDLRRPYNREQKWAMGPAAVNAYYDPEANNMVFPSGILQGVFYRDGVPASVNLGSIGFVIGHELIHGFDDCGGQYDAMGSLRQWWTNATRKRFKKIVQCFVDQYNGIVDKTANMSLNGRNTVGENIADNAAIRLAFQTYQAMLRRSQARDVLLPGLQKYSGKQLFFISTAMLWCANSRKKYLEQQIQYNPHSPPKYRVNVPLKNFPAFSRAFKCTKKSPMRLWKKKCVLW